MWNDMDEGDIALIFKEKSRCKRKCVFHQFRFVFIFSRLCLRIEKSDRSCEKMPPRTRSPIRQ